MTNLIPAYDESYNPRDGWDKYIKNTVTASEPVEIIKRLKQYLADNFCDKEIKEFINHVLSSISIINKIQLTDDGSYRNIVFLIRPDGICMTGRYGEAGVPNDHIEALNYFLDKAEVIFLNITDETWAEVEAFDDAMGYDRLDDR